ncbi:MAG: META domain-containing protein [Aquitalea sp.]|nr:META domain-containing protein [Aquitalea sp.]
MKQFWLPVLIVAGMAGCAATPPAKPQDPQQGWQAPRDLGSLDGKWQQVDAGRDQPYRLEFQSGRVHASAGCNGLGGAVSLDHGQLKMGSLMSTMMACPPPLDERERGLSQILSGNPQLTLRGDHLQLQWGTSRLEFQREPVRAGG